MLAATVPEGGTTGDSTAGDTLMPSQNEKGQPTRKEGVDATTIPSHSLTTGTGVDVSLPHILGFPGPLPPASPLTR